MPAKQPAPETEVVMAPAQSQEGALEPASARHDFVKTVAIESHQADDATDHITEELAPGQQRSLSPETDPAVDDAMFAPSDAAAARSAVVARPGPDVGQVFAPQAGPETPFQGGEPDQPAPRPAPRPPTRRSPSHAAPAVRSSASARQPVPSSRRVAVSNRRTLTWIIVVVVAASLAVAGIIIFAGGESPGRQHAGAALSEAVRQLELARSAVANRQVQQARTAYETAIHELSASSLLADPAKAPPSGKDAELAHRAAGLRADAEGLLASIRRIEADVAADGNLAALKARLARLNDPATDLDRLERDLGAFCLNPVEPTAAPDTALVETYSRLVGEAKLRQIDIGRERERRHAERMVIPVNQARLQAEGLVKDERFGDALAMVDKERAAHPDADFVPVMQMINDEAAKGWRAAKAYVDTRIADSKSAGTTENQRRASLASARERLNQVISRFGVEPYVGQAKAILATLP